MALLRREHDGLLAAGRARGQLTAAVRDWRASRSAFRHV